MLPATKSSVTFDDALLIAERCFGELGRKTVFLWKQYNRDYFGGALAATPVLYVPTSPFGHWVGLHRPDRNIYLMPPGEHRSWGFVRAALLHEMIHQNLAQLGDNQKHAGEPWCREVMRLSNMFGREIWAGKYTVQRVKGKCARVNQAAPADSQALSLNQRQIARFPHSIGLEPLILVVTSNTFLGLVRLFRLPFRLLTEHCSGCSTPKIKSDGTPASW
jgi:hypothetical protein